MATWDKWGVDEKPARFFWKPCGLGVALRAREGMADGCASILTRQVGALRGKSPNESSATVPRIECENAAQLQVQVTERIIGYCALMGLFTNENIQGASHRSNHRLLCLRYQVGWNTNDMCKSPIESSATVPIQPTCPNGDNLCKSPIESSATVP
jgi:hypothetical protein